MTNERSLITHVSIRSTGYVFHDIIFNNNIFKLSYITLAIHSTPKELYICSWSRVSLRKLKYDWCENVKNVG